MRYQTPTGRERLISSSTARSRIESVFLRGLGDCDHLGVGAHRQPLTVSVNISLRLGPIDAGVAFMRVEAIGSCRVKVDAHGEQIDA